MSVKSDYRQDEKHTLIKYYSEECSSQLSTSQKLLMKKPEKTNNTGDYNKDDSKKRSLIRGRKPKSFLMYSFI